MKMIEMSKWWLIPDETVKLVISYLEKKEDAKDVLHEFETSLNLTDQIPTDFKKPHWSGMKLVWVSVEE